MAQFIDRLQKHSGTACEPREVEDAAGGDFQVRLRPGPRRKFMELPRRRESAAVLTGMFINPTKRVGFGCQNFGRSVIVLIKAEFCIKAHFAVFFKIYKIDTPLHRSSFAEAGSHVLWFSG